MILDLALVFGITFLGFFGSYNHEVFKESIFAILLYCAGSSIVTVAMFLLLKLYRILVDNFGLADCIRIAFGYIVPATAGLIALLTIDDLHFETSHIGVWFLTFVTILFFLTIIRAVPREMKALSVILEKRKSGVRTLIVGAGGAAKVVIEESRKNRLSKNNIVVIVDDNKNKIGSIYSNIIVAGPINNVKQIITQYKVEEAIIAIADLSEDRLHEIVNYLSSCNVRVRRLPLLSEMSGPNDIRVIDVKIDDLLNRDSIKLDNREVKEMLNDKTVMVTGAGGSIGSELTRQIFNTHPSTLVLFDIYENSTYDIQQELTRRIRNENINDIKLITLIGSTYNEKRVEQVIRKYKPDYIYHAAAYKHVPLMEDSPAEAIRTNVIGTYNVAKLADKYGVKKMVLVSTDKAVRPTNTMGATKRFAETIIQYFSDKSKNTAYAAVRFGNVLGSNGSVVPLFKKQIEEGGPITLTHKDIIRYFMTIPEAVSLILQCGLYAEGGEIFILDMGKPVKIYDLAVKLIRQAGLVPEKDIKIVETGLRPGEKLFEELLLDKTVQKKTKNDRIYIEEPETIKPIEDEIKTISKVFDMDETGDVKKLLASIIDTYKIDGGK